jgi:hypothetical protein
LILAIVGSREARRDELYPKIEEALRALAPQLTCVVSGGAVGVDTWAREIAQRLGVPVREHRPDYATHGRAAPLIRNTTIVHEADRVLAFQINASRGTGDAIQKARRRGIPVDVFDGQTWEHL